MVLTCTVRTIQDKVKEKGLSVSLGKMMSLKPFFVTYPNKKEIFLCLCKLCLNARMLIEPLQAKAKKDGDSIEDSISNFFSSCPSPQLINGFYQLKYLKGKCKSCKANQATISFKCQNDDSTYVKVSQFEIRKTFYTSKKNLKKKSVQTERVEHHWSYKVIYDRLNKMKKEYLIFLYNDKFHWPKILVTTEAIGPIYHMDFSENLSQQFKYEPQSCHFNKKQYSLHCTVEHTGNSESGCASSRYTIQRCTIHA